MKQYLPIFLCLILMLCACHNPSLGIQIFDIDRADEEIWIHNSPVHVFRDNTWHPIAKEIVSAVNAMTEEDITRHTDFSDVFQSDSCEAFLMIEVIRAGRACLDSFDIYTMLDGTGIVRVNRTYLDENGSGTSQDVLSVISFRNNDINADVTALVHELFPE